MKILRFLLIAAALSLASTAQAQTVTQTLSWQELSDTLVDIQNYAYTLVVTPSGGSAGAPILLTQTCAALPAPATAGAACSAPLVTPVTAGSVLVLTATATPSASETSAGSTPSAPYTFLPPAAPGAPASISVVIKVTVP